jgi:hypothetical protein
MPPNKGKRKYSRAKESQGKRPKKSKREEGALLLQKWFRALLKKRKREKAAKRVQKWFRGLERKNVLTRQLMRGFMERGPKAVVAELMQKGPTEAIFPSISFDGVTAFLRRPETERLMTKTVLRVFYLCYGRRNTHRIAEANLNIRVFFAAYMIHRDAKAVFESIGPLEAALLPLSVRLLMEFERLCLELSTGPIQKIDRGLVMQFPDTLNEYVSAFKAWKIPDEEKLANRLKHALNALYATEAEVDGCEQEAVKRRSEVRAKIERLRLKLVQVAGEPVLRAYEAGKKLPRLPVPGAPKSPPAVEDSTAGMVQARLTNEQLAHELLFDRNFEINEGGGSSAESPVFQKMRASFHAAFWASLVSDLRLSVPCYFRVVRVLTEIRDGFSELAVGTEMAVCIAKVIDVDAIKEATSVASKNLSLLPWGECVQLLSGIIDVVKRMQAPRRDAETRLRWGPLFTSLEGAAETPALQPQAFCNALEFVLDRLNTIRVDCANVRLRKTSPLLQVCGREYMQSHFEKKIREGTVAPELPRMRALLTRTIEEEVRKGRVEVDALRGGNAAAFTHVQRASVLALATCSEGPLTRETCPEVSALFFAFFVFCLACSASKPAESLTLGCPLAAPHERRPPHPEGGL